MTRHRSYLLKIATAATLVLLACTPAAPTTEPAPAPAPKTEPAAPAAPAPPAPEAKPAQPPAKPAEAKPAEAKPEPDYYAGKTITFIAGSSPGGGTDTLARITARHLSRFIPGNPTIIVQNMPGGGGIPALNHLYHQSAPDGLTFDGSIAQTVLYAQLQGDEAVRYDLAEVTYIGNAIDDPQVLWLRSETPFTNLDDVRNATTAPRLGAQSGTHPSVIIPRVVGEVTGLEFNVITGYPGSPEIFLDVERGALDGRFASYGSLQTQRPDWIADNYVRILMTTARERLPELPEAPSIMEIVPPERESLLSLLYGPGNLSRSVLGPPGIPPEIARIVQDAFAEMVNDPEFISDMERAGFDVGYTSPEDVHESVVQLLSDEESKAVLNRLLSN